MYFPNLRTLDASVAFHARRRPDHPAVLCEGLTVTYGELHRRSGLRRQALFSAPVAFSAPAPKQPAGSRRCESLGRPAAAGLAGWCWMISWGTNC